MIDLQGVSFTYNGEAMDLDNINLTIDRGEFIVVGGVSGSGKTTLGRVINGLVPRFYEGRLQGTVRIDGKPIDDLELWQLGEYVASVFQDPSSQFFAHNVRDEIAFNAENYGIDPDIIRGKIDEISEKLGITHLLEKNMFSLSSGEQQKIAIASALIVDPPIFVMDEPTANLDQEAVRSLTEILEMLKSQGKTVVIIEHRLYYLRSLLDRFIYMENGEVGKVLDVDSFNALTPEELVNLGLREIQSSEDARIETYQGDRDANHPVLEVRDLHFSYGNKKVLKGFNMSIREGEIVALLGANGVGKTTLCSLLSGFEREKTGKILFRGTSVKGKKRRDHVFFVMQQADCQLYAESVVNELTLGDIRNLEDPSLVLDQFGLGVKSESHPAALSGGEKQRLTLAVSDVMDREILIFDEPTSGLDGKNMRATKDFFQGQSKRGKTVIVISHDMEFVRTCCHRVIELKS